MNRSKTNRCFFIVLIFLGMFGTGFSETTPPRLKPIELPDILKWKSIRQAVLADNGVWLGVQIAPVEGDHDVLLREIQGKIEYRFPAGDADRSSLQLTITSDSRWAAFFTFPDAKETAKLKREKKPVVKSLVLVNLQTGNREDIRAVRDFAFSGQKPQWIAMHMDLPEPSAASKEKPSEKTPPKGSDLLLRHLASGREYNIGNVGEFAFDKPGNRFAWTISALDKKGNGLLIRDLADDRVTVLDNGPSVYRSLSWNEKGNGLTCIKGKEDKEWEEDIYALLGFHWIGIGQPQKIEYNPAQDQSFPEAMTIAHQRAPQWLDDFSAISFGIRKTTKKESPAETEKDAKPAPKETKPAESDPDLPGLVIWHWLDPRLQSEQQVQEKQDKDFSHICLYRVPEKKFVRIGDESVRDIDLQPQQTLAVGLDRRGYQWLGNLDGREFQDVYTIDLHTGQKTLVLKQCRWYFGHSPAGDRLLHFLDGHFFVFDARSGKSLNITRNLPVSFIDEENDQNIKDPPLRPAGWSADGEYVLLSDGWDIWKVSARGLGGIVLTASGRSSGIRFQRRFRLDADEKGIDLKRPLYWSMYGERSKRGGIARIDTGAKAARSLLWDDALFRQLLKAKNAEQYIYSRETFSDCPELFAAPASLQGGTKLTDTNPQQKEYSWSAGSMLVDYTDKQGKPLQGALYLPAGYEREKSYPTIVYMYEKLTQNFNQYVTPATNGFNKSVYTSRGYAVLMPDILFRINDPGVSSTECILAALDASIATGVVDRNRVGIHGHSWGGYQTAFIVTRTDAFRAAVAGAPLTNMISMYSSIYWNTGGANQPIFESAQGRFSGGYWEQPEAYIRNSPVHFAGNVKTPLIILHNDADGAVDWNQGIEYYNTLRRLNKPVIMLQYKGENHGLVKPENRKDYTIRMAEFFDHHLQGKAAPEWLEKGIAHLELDQHLKMRLKPKKDPEPVK